MTSQKKVHHKPLPPKNNIMKEKLGAALQEEGGVAVLVPPPILVTPEDHRAAQASMAVAAGDLPVSTKEKAEPPSPWKTPKEGKPRYTEAEKALFNLRRRVQGIEEENRKLNQEMDDLVKTCQAALDEAAARETKMVELMEGMRQVAMENLAAQRSPDLEGLKEELRQEFRAAMAADMAGFLEGLAADVVSGVEVTTAEAQLLRDISEATLAQAPTPATPENTFAASINSHTPATQPFYKRPSVQGAAVGTVAGAAAAYGLKRLFDSLDKEEC
jgi:hypothetical protein